MWPTLVEIESPTGTSGLHTYGLLVMTAFVVAFGVLLSRGRRVGIGPVRLVELYLVAAVGGMTGARLLYVLAVGEPGALFSCQGGFAYYGGVIGGTVAVAAVARARALHLWKLADVAVPALVIGNAIGRIGCFFAGCCHGMPVSAPDPRTALLPEGLLHGQVWLHPHFPFLSTEFHAGVGRLWNEPLYPTQLWQSASALLVFVLLSWVWTRRRFDGQVTAVALMTEPALRILNEAFRADHRGYVWSWQVEQPPAWLAGMASAGSDLPVDGPALIGLTTSQGIGLVMMLGGAVIYALRRDRGVDPETPAAELWEDDLAP
jgi:phosphatidylglycerol:prolipoprotein diacylglycerol transferase